MCYSVCVVRYTGNPVFVREILPICTRYRHHCAKRNMPLFNLLRGRFWGFSPLGDTLHRLGWNVAWRRGLYWHGGGDLRSPLPCHISPPNQSVQRLGYRSPKLKFLLRFDQNVVRGISLARFSQNLQSLYPVSGCVSHYKFRWILLQGLWLVGSFDPQKPSPKLPIMCLVGR